MNFSKNKNLILSQIREGVDGLDCLIGFKDTEDGLESIVQFDEIQQYRITVQESGHFFITSVFNNQDFLLRAFLKTDSDVNFIAQTVRLVFQVEDEIDEQFL